MKKLLFIRYRKPGGISEGGEQVTNMNLQILKSLFGEQHVDTFYIHKSLSKGVVLLKALFIFIHFLRGYYYGLSPRKVRGIARLAVNYDYVFIDRSIFGVIAKELKEQAYQGKIFTFFHNIESTYFSAKIGPYKPWRKMVVACADKNDREACLYSDKIITLNHRDAEALKAKYDRLPDIISPVVFEDIYDRERYPTASTKKCPICLFVGSYFPMNTRGILWFIREVLPHVNIQLQIVGKGMDAIRKSITPADNIEIISDAPSLQPYIEAADFMILPIFEGSGMKIKTCESLMYGKNIIGTTEAFEGYALDFNQVGNLCNTREAFIEAIQQRCADPIPRFNAYARQVFLDNHAAAVRVENFKQLFEPAQ
jgi:hypothetical protein